MEVGGQGAADCGIERASGFRVRAEGSGGKAEQFRISKWELRNSQICWSSAAIPSISISPFRDFPFPIGYSPFVHSLRRASTLLFPEPGNPNPKPVPSLVAAFAVLRRIGPIYPTPTHRPLCLRFSVTHSLAAVRSMVSQDRPGSSTRDQARL